MSPPASRLSGDQLHEIHRAVVVECIPELSAAYDAGRPERVALILEVPGSIEARIGFGEYDDVVSDLLDVADAGGSAGIKQLAADLAGGPPAAPGHFFCIVVVSGLAACYEFEVALLTS